MPAGDRVLARPNQPATWPDCLSSGPLYRRLPFGAHDSSRGGRLALWETCTLTGGWLECNRDEVLRGYRTGSLALFKNSVHFPSHPLYLWLSRSPSLSSVYSVGHQLAAGMDCTESRDPHMRKNPVIILFFFFLTLPVIFLIASPRGGGWCDSLSGPLPVCYVNRIAPNWLVPLQAPEPI